MNSIEKKRAQRFLYLKRLYERSGGRTRAALNSGEIGKDLGWDDATIADVVGYLADEHLIKPLTFTKVVLTHYGVRLMEEALSTPSQSTHYFPPASVIIVVNGDFVFSGDIIGRDQTNTNTAGGDIVGRDKTGGGTDMST